MKNKGRKPKVILTPGKKKKLEYDTRKQRLANEIHGLSLAGVGDQGKATSETSTPVTTESELAAGGTQKTETK